MKRVITYGTYDLLHNGHIRLLERAKALGDYLIVGVTSDDYDRTRGKINVQQSVGERVAAIQSTGIADRVIIEEYEGQKIDDIKKYDIDIFTVGSDWIGQFDYLKEYCEVVYLPRTEGISSSDIRTVSSGIRLGVIGYSSFLNKFYRESKFVNAISIKAICTNDLTKLGDMVSEVKNIPDYNTFLDEVDAVYIHSHPKQHYLQCKTALMKKKHVLCESPIAETMEKCGELYDLATDQGCVLMEGIRTAYLMGYARLLLLLKAGKIGRIVSVDATCTSLSVNENFGNNSKKWGALEVWGPTALLPVFQILGSEYESLSIYSASSEEWPDIDGFTKLDFRFKNAVASVKVGTSIKSESNLVISGTLGYVYVPAPWWKTDYFELRYENPTNNRRYFYQIDGEGIRYELVQFASSIRKKQSILFIERTVSEAISNVIEKYNNRELEGSL